MRRYRGLVVGSVVVVVGCRQILGIDEPGHEQDAPPPSDAPSCYGDTSAGSLITVCLQPTLNNAMLDTAVDTDTDPRCASLTPPVGPEVCVVEAVDITIDGQIALTGKRPLVIVGTHTISIKSTAVLDASSRLGTHDGPDANDPSCPTVMAGVMGGGGAGGSFGASGGNGADGGAKSPPGQAPIFVRGGCPGSSDASAGLQGSGPGGGAVYLIAGSSISIDGVILANGGGGRAPTGPISSAGGGGGGAGGLVGLDAPMVTGNGAIMAVGGGGGEGGPAGVGSAADGQDPSGIFNQIAKGGAISDTGGNGGNGGGFGAMAANGGSGSGSGSNVGGGGGGGGSVGVVWVRAKTFTVTNVSPSKRP